MINLCCMINRKYICKKCRSGLCEEHAVDTGDGYYKCKECLDKSVLIGIAIIFIAAVILFV